MWKIFFFHDIPNETWFWPFFDCRNLRFFQKNFFFKNKFIENLRFSQGEDENIFFQKVDFWTRNEKLKKCWSVPLESYSPWCILKNNLMTQNSKTEGHLWLYRDLSIRKSIVKFIRAYLFYFLREVPIMLDKPATESSCTGMCTCNTYHILHECTWSMKLHILHEFTYVLQCTYMYHHTYYEGTYIHYTCTSLNL